jgi:hypothetical protein
MSTIDAVETLPPEWGITAATMWLQGPEPGFDAEEVVAARETAVLDRLLVVPDVGALQGPDAAAPSGDPNGRSAVNGGLTRD